MADSVSASPPPASVLRDPVAAQKALHADNQAYFNDMDQVAFNGNGNASYWLNRTELAAVRSLAYATRATLRVNEGRTDPPALEAANAARIAGESKGIAQTAEKWRQGYGDANYWFERAKGMGIECTGGAAVAAALCDGSQAAALRPRIEQGLLAADNAQFGSGQAPYWSARAAQEASAVTASLGSLAPTPPPGATGAATPSALQNDLEQLNRSLDDDLSRLVFGKTGQATDWMYRAEHVGIRGAQQAARMEMRLAAEHADTPADAAAHSSEITKAVAAFQADADAAATGTGNAKFWLDRNVGLARTAAAFAEKVAASCDASTVKVAGPLLEQAMTTAESAAYNGNGYAQYWMDKIIGSADSLKTLAEDVRIHSQAGAAAAAAGTPDSTPERRTAEQDRARQQTIADAWNQVAASKDALLASYQAQMQQAAQTINPLVAKDQKLLPWLRRANYVLVPSGAAFVGGLILAHTLPPVGLGLALAGGVAAAISGAVRFKLASKHGAIMAAYVPANTTFQQAQAQSGRVRKDADYAHSRAQAAEASVRQLEGDLQIHRMADAVNHTAPSAEKVTVGTDVIHIGHLAIPRRAEEPDEAVSAAG